MRAPSSDSLHENKGDYYRYSSRYPGRLEIHDSRDQSRSRFRDSSRNRFDRSRSPSRSSFGDKRPRWSNEYPRMNLLLRNITCIGCGSS